MKAVFLLVCLAMAGCSWLLGGGETPDAPDAGTTPMDASVDAPVPDDCAFEPLPEVFCAPGVCDRRANACIPSDSLVYVDLDRGSNNSICDMLVPCDTISRGLTVARGESSRGIVYIAPGDYLEMLTHAGDAVRLIGFGATLTGDGSAPPIAVNGTGKLLVDGLTITSSEPLIQSTGVSITGSGTTSSSIDLFRVLIHGHGADGFAADMATVTIDASRIFNNGDDGAFFGESTVTLTSTSIYNNTALGVVALQGTAESFALNTIADNSGGAITCGGGGLVGDFVGNIVVGAITSCVNSHSYSYVNGDTAGQSNIAALPTFAMPATGDYRLTSASTGIDHVVGVSVGLVDVNGTPRVVGVLPNVGAHEEVAP